MVYIEECDDVDNCFLHRLNTYPLGASAIETTASAWNTVKDSTSVTQNVMGKFENLYGNITEAPVVNSAYRGASYVGARMLKGFEHFVPQAREITPADVQKKINGVYEGSRIQAPVEKVRQTGSTIIGKTQDGYDVARAYLTAFIATLFSLVDKTEGGVEYYVGNDLESVNGKDATYIRIYRMPVRVAQASIVKAKRLTRRSIAYAAESLESTKKMYAQARDYAAAKYSQAYDGVVYCISMPSELTLRGVKRASSFNKRVLNSVHDYTTAWQYSPQFVVSASSAINDYANDVNESAEKTQTVSELTGRLYNEACHRFNQAKSAALYVADRFQSKAKLE